VQGAIEGEHDTATLERVTVSLEINKQAFGSSFRNLERLFMEDRWSESDDVESQVKGTSIKYIQSAESALRQVTEKLKALRQMTEKLKSTDEMDEVVLKDSRSFGRSSRSRLSYAASTSARMKALADAAAARKEAEYDVLIAERENERKQLEAEEERNRIAAKAQHERHMAVLAATKRKASAEAKLDAIEQFIN
jgi:DNA polymerase II large subunit